MGTRDSRDSKDSADAETGAVSCTAVRRPPFTNRSMVLYHFAPDEKEASMLRNRRSGTGRTVRRVLAVLLMAGVPGLAAASEVELVSRAPWRRAPDTAGAGHPLGRSPLSADGRYFVYSSDASNLVRGQMDPNAGTDVFLYDRLQGTTALVSRVPGSAVTAGDDRSYDPVLSADGRYVAFVSQARNLVPGLQNVLPGRSNVFLYERATGKVTLASRRTGSGEAANGFSMGPFL